MKKIYALASAALLTSSVVAQSNDNVRTELTQPYVNMSKTAPSILKRAPQAPVVQTKNNTILEENWDSGNAFPNGWTVQSGPASTITVPTVQAWHESTTTGNPGNSATSTYQNATDVHDEWLISPSVTLPSNSTALRVIFDFFTSRFWHVTPNNNADITLNVSTDGGTNWTSLWVEDSVQFDTFQWKNQMVDVSSYAGNTVVFGFHYSGQNGAQFNVDNIKVLEVIGVDLVSVNSAWNFGGPGQPIIPYTKVPVSQAANVKSLVQVNNVGSSTAHNSKANITVSGAGTYTGTTASADVAVGVEDTLFDNTGFSIASLGNYSVLTSLSSDSTDQELGNNIDSLSFEVTSGTYARHDSTFAGWYGTRDQDNDGLLDPVRFQIDFEINAQATVYGMRVAFTNAGWQSLEINYNIFDGGGTGLYGTATNPLPTATIQNSDLSPTNGSSIKWVYLPFQTGGNPGITLDPTNGSSFTFAISHEIDSLFIPVGGNDAYANPGTWTTTGLIYDLTGGGTTNNGFYITDNYLWELDFDGPNSIDEVATTVEVGQNIPNPANATTRIPFSVEKATKIDFVVTDLTGKIVEKRAIGTVSAGKHNITLNTNKMSNGIYYYSVIANGKAVTKKLSIAK